MTNLRKARRGRSRAVVAAAERGGPSSLLAAFLLLALAALAVAGCAEPPRAPTPLTALEAQDLAECRLVGALALDAPPVTGPDSTARCLAAKGY